MSTSAAPAPTDSIADVVRRIVRLNRELADFWAAAHGWAPKDAAQLLSASRLDRQVALSSTLDMWTSKETLPDGELILAWANLGALVEGTLKLLFVVFLDDYRADTTALERVRALDRKKSTPHLPDVLELEKLRQLVQQRDLLESAELELIALIQYRRNAIHAFKDRPLGDRAEFHGAVRGYLTLLRAVNDRLPYPDEVYSPRDE